MERRLDEGKPLDRHSVASFFVSRVDTEVDKRLEAISAATTSPAAPGSPTPAPPTARSSASFGGDRFAALREAGAPVQRPLWASTGVKNPAYPETMYVYGLVGPDTVNTMPLPTLTAAAREGEVTGATAADDPTADLDALRDAGIDLDDVTEQLLRDGIDAFVVPMNKLLDGIESKREAIVTGRPETIEADLPAALEQAVAGRLRRALDDDVVHRIWHRDATLWGARGHARDHRPARLARHLREDARARRRARGVRRGGSRRRLHRRRAAGDGRLEPRARGVPALVAGARDAPARARLDAPGPDRGDGRRDRPRQDAVHRLVQVRRHDRDDVAVQVLPRAPGRRRALRGGHRPGHFARRARPARTASGACSRTTPRSAGATRRCPTSGSCRPRCSASTSARCSRPRRSRSRTAA